MPVCVICVVHLCMCSVWYGRVHVCVQCAPMGCGTGSSPTMVVRLINSMTCRNKVNEGEQRIAHMRGECGKSPALRPQVFLPSPIRPPVRKERDAQHVTPTEGYWPKPTCGAKCLSSRMMVAKGNSALTALSHA